ncbi:MAG: D-allulose-6-phosphate 3-epimerase [Mesorhizobium sp.]|uniref:ribulose-phosphate 3-epimerase n=1 Tax=Mesorhizobium sp. TaxID=1871066 RepID=UPI000FE885C8|nr:ribulose-phosphate 3-epimerase [Mesorhizobium sp.]RWM22590.1 MAG: D-allulose-6-phosphate 3-epimerase [Mesorhizobium sp.]TIP75446.1 MAG: D-allulose-6-phosphate 3-epimerase [Mesorhizobium sp.]TIQ14119.1 MAG: D-allulose-6-phosphate 3-epimerase [Mesorhizobium sp.]TIR52952.1 MAG: D-allulose-6-phosphate 3-epimerase [Mesorhizobium sp.]TJV98701.1 MAG: D-allulose-6-phosphate 3-epimerase [Mesorhizobium sp.]
MTTKSLSGPAAIAALPRNRLLGEFSLWSADLANMERDLQRIDPFVDLHHIDVADARFTPGFLFFPDLVARIAGLTARPIHVHLMVEAEIVEEQTRQFIQAGADLVSVHAENGEAGLRAVRLAHELGAEAGVVLRLETPVAAVTPFLSQVAFVTLLGTSIGVKGQSLSEQACPRLIEARTLMRQAGREADIILAADGGIRHETVARLRAAGAETVVLGSLAFGDPDLAQRMAWLHGLKVAA